jgi:UDP-galactopyranose mutase
VITFAAASSPGHDISTSFLPSGHTLICFSHLRWNFVFRRPQHLMSRFSRGGRVVYWEEPEEALPECEAAVGVRTCAETGVVIVTPSLPEAMGEAEREAALRTLLDDFLAEEKGPLIRWYYTPAMLPFSRHIESRCTIYDCVDELAASEATPLSLLDLERELLASADLVFTSGFSLYQGKKGLHPNAHPFPSSVDRAHFAQARAMDAAPDDQAMLPRPRLGYYGIVDERTDLELLAALADARPHWSLVIVGPVKVDPADLPQRANIHFLGPKNYEELPAYLGGWDAALMPFAIDESTKLISPTKTPEYLAGGRPVVSTPVTDVIRHYGDLKGVFVADGADDYIEACEEALALARGDGDWLAEVDAKLANLSWETTHARMAGLVREAIEGPDPRSNVVEARQRTTQDHRRAGVNPVGPMLPEQQAS